MHLFLIYLLTINTIAFLLNGIDKGMAVRQKRRIAEKTLLGLALTGGTLGSAVAMLLFRHKTAKIKYLLTFFAIMAIQGMLLFLYFKA